MKRNRNATAGQEAHFSVRVLPAPSYLLANPLPAREHEYAKPDPAWLEPQPAVPPLLVTTGNVIRHHTVSVTELARAADFLWTLRCEFEKVQRSALEIRKPFPPHLSRCLRRFAHAAPSRRKTDVESQA